MTEKFMKNVYVAALAFCFLVLSFVGIMNYKTNHDAQELLRESIESQLTSIAIAAKEIIDAEQFNGYNTLKDAESEEYIRTLGDLRALQIGVGANYIYALKKIGNEFFFIFDTDAEDPEVFIPYELSAVHYSAFSGVESVELQIEDEYGTFNTAAVPIRLNGRLIGIVCADIEDTLLTRSIAKIKLNSAILIIVLVATFGLIAYLVRSLLMRLKEVHDRLNSMAHFDKLTNLPNRQYLLEHLTEITTGNESPPFALLFIDLDNFKKVNDNAGHDAGDSLLKNIGIFLNGYRNNNEVFRPASGNLNVTARVGGDEFILIAKDISDAETAQEFADGLLSDFKTSYVDRRVEKYQVGLSIGVALFPYHSDNYHVLIKYADIAMYQSKAAGKSCAKVYSEEMGAEHDS